MHAIVLKMLLGAFVVALTAASAFAQAPQVTADTYPSEVIEASNSAPVFVNFYAPWCGPCRPLFDVLETVAADYERRATLVSVNVDESPVIGAELGISSIPVVVAFRDGEAVETLVGNLPEPEVRELFESHVAAAEAPQRERPEFMRDDSSSLPCIGDACDAVLATPGLVLDCRIRNQGDRAIMVRVYEKSGNVLTTPEIMPGSDASLGTPTGCIRMGDIDGLEASYAE